MDWFSFCWTLDLNRLWRLPAEAKELSTDPQADWCAGALNDLLGGANLLLDGLVFSSLAHL